MLIMIMIKENDIKIELTLYNRVIYVDCILIMRSNVVQHRCHQK